jgi:hypothetical protein
MRGVSFRVFVFGFVADDFAATFGAGIFTRNAIAVDLSCKLELAIQL